ncbi:hypothetical protein T440DRAFT_444791 [Plenodomus tracheiphilus IPT5]|uniref:Uncharacterized protein n=1 Tax=Plenodomus tracheiphilus IPT5 TaxID=1408161 RepID=A0A6A7BFW8_9PLEO|nr:hypothetical protein T440DRAFT_444791 [Plenodomus tracheiphilus IPT5]
MPSHSRIANLALVAITGVTSVAHAYQDDQVWSALAILNTFDPHNAEPFCAGFIHYQQPSETCWVTDAPVTVTTTTACGASGYPITPAPKPTGYEPGAPGVITVLTTTTITYTTTSTIYVPAATPYAAAYPAAKRDTFCPDYDVPCRLVQFNYDVIAAACSKYLGQSGGAATVTKYVHAATATVTAEACATPGYDAKPADGGEGYDTAPAAGGYHTDGGEHDDGYDGGYVGDGEDTPSGLYDGTVGDGEDTPPGVYDNTAGDGEDAPPGLSDEFVGDGEDTGYHGGPPAAGDGEDLPDEFYIDGTNEEAQDDGTGYSPYTN